MIKRDFSSEKCVKNVVQNFCIHATFLLDLLRVEH